MSPSYKQAEDRPDPVPPKTLVVFERGPPKPVSVMSSTSSPSDGLEAAATALPLKDELQRCVSLQEGKNINSKDVQHNAFNAAGALTFDLPSAP